MVQYAVVKNEPRDLETLMDRLQSTKAKLQAAFDEFNRVMDLAEKTWPKQESPVGVVKICKKCGRSYSERRDTHSSEYGFCSINCFRQEKTF